MSILLAATLLLPLLLLLLLLLLFLLLLLCFFFFSFYYFEFVLTDNGLPLFLSIFLSQSHTRRTTFYFLLAPLRSLPIAPRPCSHKHTLAVPA